MHNLTIHLASEYTLKHRFAHLKYLESYEENPGLFDLKSFGKSNRQVVGLTYTFEWDFDHLQQVEKKNDIQERKYSNFEKQYFLN